MSCMAPRALAVWALIASSGYIYANVNTPLSYRSPTPADVPVGQMGPEVQGTACNYAVLGLVAWGDGGYAAAVEEAKTRSGAQLLADVKADRTFFNVLGVYQRSCTQVTGKTVR
ncbi:MAG: hypothetical protein HY901_34920 [Deltaproteobacteria bacterium]|nr:hypothetical protein [Deltaproteobacteria bacterium]